jgi:hypothetical protein
VQYDGVNYWSWPEGLTIEACVHSEASTAQFYNDRSVLGSLNLRYFVEMHEAQTDSLWRHEGIVPPAGHVSMRTGYWFQLDVSPEWAGRYLCFRAHFNSPDYGDLTSPVAFSLVTMPCSKKDSSLIGRGNIYCTGDRRDYIRLIEITDSLLQTR